MNDGFPFPSGRGDHGGTPWEKKDEQERIERGGSCVESERENSGSFDGSPDKEQREDDVERGDESCAPRGDEATGAPEHDGGGDIVRGDIVHLGDEKDVRTEEPRGEQEEIVRDPLMSLEVDGGDGGGVQGRHGTEQDEQSKGVG